MVSLEKKKTLRRYYLSVRQNLSSRRRSEAEERIEHLFFNLKEVDAARRFLLYHSFRDEVSTVGIMNELLAKNKEVYLPKTRPELKCLELGRVINPSRDLIPGYKGIMEPRNVINIKPEELDVVVVPGLVFDKKGYRLGYGGGYYDRFLAQAPETLLKIGLVYHELLVDELPVERHDIPVEIIITDEGIYDSGSGRYEPF